MLLWFGIFFFPIIFVWFLFRKGYSTLARIIGLVWLLLPIVFILGSQKGVTEHKTTQNPTPTISNSQAIGSSSEVLIPRRDAGDKGKYYLIEAKKEGSIYKVLHKRVGVDATGYTRTEINCQTLKFREMGYSEVSPHAMTINPTVWAEIVEGSSKSDLVHFVCQQ